jgi:hypothetical protein
MTQDYKRNGAIDLFAALNVATGEVLTNLRKGHTGADMFRLFTRSTPQFQPKWTSISSWTT